MFTGLIKESGKVKRLTREGRLYRLEVESKEIFKRAAIGDSVSVNGVCLTITGKENGCVSFDVMEETLSKSSISKLKINDAVNLEDALRAGEPFGGHFVLGHVDCIGDIAGIKRSGDSVSVEIKFPEEFKNLLVERGSVAVDGISLTIGEIRNNSFFIHIIPHTLDNTTLRQKRQGDKINIEFDILGKYALKAGKSNHPQGVDENLLRENGWA